MQDVRLTAAIDDAIVASLGHHLPRKTVMVIMLVLERLGCDDGDEIAERIAGRIRYLVSTGVLTSKGDLSRWRWSEVCLPKA